MISVCMAVKDGELFIKEQISSILTQLGVNDELIVSDDHSSDSTLEIINSFQDKRIKIFCNPGSGILNNFENALRHSSGEKIFLSDQDDVWHKDKVGKMGALLDHYDVIVCDCTIVDHQLNPQHESFFKINKSSKGMLKNIFKNSYMGCCMAFNRSILEKILPFPDKIPMHDLWIGLNAELYFSVFFLPEKLVFYRRHSNNASSDPKKSSQSLKIKMSGRLHLIKNLLVKSYA
ncbi:MAG TPA: alpha-L-Rha alpha-1,3-L-rhamnosyltransferase [Cytophagales bacterium]|nr:alpha-L-Rha alpha-1,3-L-rhamnosyltransferase [Cytophagales bacterium]